MPRKKVEAVGTNCDTPETGVLEGSELAVVERVYTPAEMAKMSDGGMSNPAIGKIVRLTGERVRQIIKKYRAEHAEMEVFKEQEVDINAGIRRDILASMTPEQIKATKSIRDRAVTYGILVDKARLLSGESTSNIGVITKWSDVVHQSQQRFAADPVADSIDSSGILDQAYLERCRKTAREEGRLDEQLAWEADTRRRLKLSDKEVAE